MLVFPADDDFNAAIIDDDGGEGAAGRRHRLRQPLHSRRLHGRLPLAQGALVRAAAFTLYYIARLPTHDATSGFRLFSRRVIDGIAIESDQRLLLQHRIAGEVPSARLAGRRSAGQMVRAQAGRKAGFGCCSWLPAYLRWYCYAFATTFLRLPANSVKLRSA